MKIWRYILATTLLFAISAVVSGNSPIYPIERLLQGEEGYALLEYSVSREGVVGDFANLGSSHSSYFTHSRAAMRKWQVTPATIQGEPVAVKCKLKQNFGQKHKRP